MTQVEKMMTQIKPRMMTQIRKADYAEKTEKVPAHQWTERIIGCCYQVHNQLGPGFPEKVYQAALVIALRQVGLLVEEERYFDVSFDGQTVGAFRADLLVEQSIIVEVKATSGPLPKLFTAQLVAYLRAAKLAVGLLVNFGNISCQIKRVSNSKR